MPKSLRSALAGILGFLGPALLALGTFLPMLRLREFEYTYSIVGTPAILIYGIAVIVFTLNVISVKLLNDVVLQLHFVAMALLAGCLVYGLKISGQGLDWFASRLAYDAPTWKHAQLDAYWFKLNELTGGGTTIVGSLRTLYDAYGPGFTYNDVALFADAINGLSAGQARSLIDAAGVPFDVLPVGIICFAASLMLQVVVFVVLPRTRTAV